jgi:hypothetical protein
VPSPWLTALTPLVLWLSLHREDKLAASMFKHSPVLKQELIRIHSLLEVFCVDSQQNKDKDQQADRQLALLELMGTTLIFEENFILGFLPLRSYFLNRKSPELSGKKSPGDKEEMLRCLIIKEGLELLGCVDKQDAETHEPTKVEDFFAQIDSQDQSRPTQPREKPLIVLDVQNIAMRHGKDKVFSTKGIMIAVQYWVKNGHKVICFLPEYLFNYEEVSKNKRLAEMGLKSTKASKLPDSVGALNQLLQQGVMVKTPAQDYDDSYCISYAR